MLYSVGAMPVLVDIMAGYLDREARLGLKLLGLQTAINQTNDVIRSKLRQPYMPWCSSDLSKNQKKAFRSRSVVALLSFMTSSIVKNSSNDSSNSSMVFRTIFPADCSQALRLVFNASLKAVSYIL